MHVSAAQRYIWYDLASSLAYLFYFIFICLQLRIRCTCSRSVHASLGIPQSSINMQTHLGRHIVHIDDPHSHQSFPSKAPQLRSYVCGCHPLFRHSLNHFTVFFLQFPFASTFLLCLYVSIPPCTVAGDGPVSELSRCTEGETGTAIQQNSGCIQDECTVSEPCEGEGGMPCSKTTVDWNLTVDCERLS